MEVYELKVASRLLKDMDAAFKLKSLNLTEQAIEDPYLKGVIGVAIRYTARTGEPITFDAFRMHLEDKTREPAPYLAAFMTASQTVCTAGEFDSAVRILRQRRITNSISVAIERTIDELQGDKEGKKLPAEEIAKNFRKRALDVGRETGVSYASEGTLTDSIDERLAELDKKLEDPMRFTGSLSPWARFNEVTNGVMPGEMLVVVAEPGGGKSTYMIDMSTSAYERGDNVIYFSHELSRRQLEQRYDTVLAALLFPDTRLVYRQIRDGRMNSTERRVYADVLDYQRSRPNQVYIIDDPSLDVAGIREKLEQLSGEMKIGQVAVDYLGIIPGASGGWEQVSKVTQELYVVGRELNIPIITAAQKNPEGGIGLSYLIKAHASMVVRINQDEAMRLAGELEQDFLKNREGSTPRFNCVTDWDRILIEDLREVTTEE